MLQQQQTALTEQIDRDREEAFRQLPALRRETVCLTDDEVMVRDNAATVLRYFGKAAKSAIPELVRAAREDKDLHVRTRAAESLRMISPERADGEGL